VKTVERAFGAYLISTDRSRLDLDAIYAYLSGESYWARGRPRDQIVRGIENSLPFGVYRDGAQVGFARIVTDYATFAWLADVYVLESQRGNGVGKALIETIVEHPAIRGLPRLMLATADAHGLYEQYGFTPLRGDERFMAIEAKALTESYERDVGGEAGYGPDHES
jgi:GNAT superfamily N-acetyltransferase